MSGITTGQILLGLGAALGGTLLQSVMSPKVDKPGTPTGPAVTDDNEANKRALAAQRKQREAAAAAVGRADTIAGNSIGSASSTGNAAVKTLIGL